MQLGYAVKLFSINTTNIEANFWEQGAQWSYQNLPQSASKPPAFPEAADAIAEASIIETLSLCRLYEGCRVR